jgi:hypothetical protein
MFFDTFTNYNKQLSEEEYQKYNSSEFLSFPKTIDTIDKLKPIFEKLITKPQKLIEDNDDYYVARDILTNTVYICFKNMLVLDIDIYKSVEDENEILQLLERSGYTFRVYKTRNGFHAFCTSQTFDYSDKKTIDWMIHMKCDFFYAFYCHLRGFCVRLNRKMDEYFEMMSVEPGKRNKVDDIYQYIGCLGNDKAENQELCQLAELHMKYVAEYKTHTPVG